MNQGARILVVDDEPQNRRLLEALLLPQGYQTTSVADGEAALAAVAAQAPDLILLDVMMPGMDGHAVARALKAEPTTAHIPIIMVTAQIDPAARLLGLNAGAEEFLTKPVDRAELWLRVRNLLRLKALSDLLQDHSRLLEDQVLARTESLHRSELRFRQMAENIRDAFYLIDADSQQVLYISPAYEDIWQRSCASLMAAPTAWHTAIHPDDAVRVNAQFDPDALVAECSQEFRILRPDSTVRWVHTRNFAVRDASGCVVRIAGVAQDVTEQREAAARIAYLNRVYAVLSCINNLIVRVRDRKALFDGACRIAVEHGHFRMAWIGVADHALNRIDPVASCGVSPAMLAVIKARFTLTPDRHTGLGDSVTAHAMRLQRVHVSNDALLDPKIQFLTEYAAADIRSLAIFPLVVGGQAHAVLVLYATELDFFHAEEVKLLTELAGDIAFGIDHLAQQARLDYLAYYDELTGLANRSLFLERCALYLRAAASGGHGAAVFLIDLARFKNINASLGHAAGDELLRQVAQWLVHHAGAADLTARIGADQFAMVLPAVRAGGNLSRLLERGMAAFVQHPFHLNDAVFRVAVKVGVAVFPTDGSDAEGLLRNAEAALKQAKLHGDRFVFYETAMSTAVAGQPTLEHRLREALDRQEFVLHYQPKLNLVTGKLTSAEALIRWNDPQRGLVPPGSFIPMLEEIGLIGEVGAWALRQAMTDWLAWQLAGLPAVRIAVNVSALQLRDRGFIDLVRDTVGRAPNAAQALELEITETVIMAGVQHSIASLHAFRALGVRIAIDDFGTGFSSLAYLATLPVDTLKIDRSFVTDMTNGPQALALVSTIVTLAHSLQLNVVAEGVETDAQRQLLRLLGCDEMQGFLYSKAVPAGEFESRFLRSAVTV
jgi:diguanylate cyclase (GGDEF)-like protein/PAS domain S-box-containing protein